MFRIDSASDIATFPRMEGGWHDTLLRAGIIHQHRTLEAVAVNLSAKGNRLSYGGFWLTDDIA